MYPTASPGIDGPTLFIFGFVFHKTRKANYNLSLQAMGMFEFDMYAGHITSGRELVKWFCLCGVDIETQLTELLFDTKQVGPVGDQHVYGLLIRFSVVKIIFLYLPIHDSPPPYSLVPALH